MIDPNSRLSNAIYTVAYVITGFVMCYVFYELFIAVGAF